MNIEGLLETGTPEEIRDYLEKTLKEYEIEVNEAIEVSATAIIANAETSNQLLDDLLLSLMDNMINHAVNAVRIKVALRLISNSPCCLTHDAIFSAIKSLLGD